MTATCWSARFAEMKSRTAAVEIPLVPTQPFLTSSANWSLLIHRRRLSCVTASPPRGPLSRPSSQSRRSNSEGTYSPRVRSDSRRGATTGYANFVKVEPGPSRYAIGSDAFADADPNSSKATMRFN